MTLSLERLTEGLDAASAHVGVPDALAGSALRGGRRRLRRRRVTSVVAAGALTVAVALGVPALLPHSAYDTTRPTTGQLAGDGAYRTAVLQAWDASHARSDNASRGIFADLRGPARVVWAGTTAGGRAAVVAQDAVLHRHADLSPDDDGPRTLYGFVGDDGSGSPVVVGDDYRPGGVPEVRGWYVDPARSVLAVLTEGRAYGVSTGWAYGTDGSARRSAWQPVADLGGGVGQVRVTPGTDLRLAVQPFRSFDDLREVTGGPVPVEGHEDRRLPWSPGSVLDDVRQVGGACRTGLDYSRLDTLVQARLEPLVEQGAYSEGSSLWYLCGTTPDGRDLVVGEHQLDTDPSHLYVLLGDRTIGAGPIDPATALPVHARLPDGQGWVVASYGAGLRWRHAGGTWHAAGRDAALLPDGTDLQVETTRAGQAPAVTALG